MPATPTRKYTRLDADSWKALLGLYATGVNTVEELAARYDVSTSAIMQRARLAGITRRASFRASVGTATAGIAAAASGATSLAPIADKATAEERITATNDAAYLGALAIQRMLDASIAAFTMPTSSVEAAALIRALDQAAAVQERVNKIRRTVLRLDRENMNSDVILPELPIREMTAEEYLALRAEQAREDQAHSVASLDRDLGALTTGELIELDDRVAEGCDDD